MQFKIIDGLGPFVKQEAKVTNWSKVPFSYYEEMADPKKAFAGITDRFNQFCQRVNQIGYNAISLDDLAHLVILDFYPDQLKKKLTAWQELYKQLISIAKEADLQVFINTDIMFFNREIRDYCQENPDKNIEVIEKSLNQLFRNFEVAGIITRIGEADGIDVRGWFKSQVVIKKPQQANYYIKKILPLLEQRQKYWLFRTWTIGQGTIGDLIWNEKTYQKTFQGVNSDFFILSMKYGQADFFRQLELNPLFDQPGLKKIIELQSKREYEGLGRLPFYTGWQYEKYYKKLKDNNLVGIMVWCQTGGWGKSNQITFLDNSSPWVELNTISTLQIFSGQQANAALADFFPSEEMKQFIAQYNKISAGLLYPKNPVRKYFQQLRLPAPIWFYWTNLTVNDLLASYLNFFYDGPTEITEDDLASLYQLGQTAKVPDLEFIMDTLRVIFDARNCLDGNDSLPQLRQQITEHNHKYPNWLQANVGKSARPNSFLTWFMRKIFRNQQGYRWVDRFIFGKPVLKLFYRIAIWIYPNYFPQMTNRQATPLDKLLT